MLLLMQIMPLVIHGEPWRDIDYSPPPFFPLSITREHYACSQVTDEGHAVDLSLSPSPLSLLSLFCLLSEFCILLRSMQEGGMFLAFFQ